MSKLQPLYPWNTGVRGPRRTILKRSSPWNGNYALPRNVWDESRSGGAIVTRQLKSGTVFPFKAGRAGYAVPRAIQREQWRRVAVSPGAKRGTISQNTPNAFSGLGSLDGASLGYWGEGFVDDVGSGIKSAAKGAWKGIKYGAKAAFKTVCKVAPMGGGVPSPYAQGVAMAANGLCPKGSVPVDVPATPATPPPIQGAGGVSTNTLLIAGAGIVALVLLTRK